jgi:hypothetical protein
VNQTADAYRDGVTNLQNTATSQSISSSQQYESDMKVAIDQQAQAPITEGCRRDNTLLQKIPALHASP